MRGIGLTQQEIKQHWDASLYEQQENYRHDVDLLLGLLGGEPRRVLDVACGAGRMALPHRRAGEAGRHGGRLAGQV